MNKYNLSEINQALEFIKVMCGDDLDFDEIAFLRKKVYLSLKHYDDESESFIPLREFATELDCLFEEKISLLKKNDPSTF